MKHISITEFRPVESNPVPRIFRYVVPNIIVITALLWGGFYLAAVSIASIWPH